MLHNFLAGPRGIHFEAATCEPFLKATETRSHLLDDITADGFHAGTSSLPGSKDKLPNFNPCQFIISSFFGAHYK